MGTAARGSDRLRTTRRRGLAALLVLSWLLPCLNAWAGEETFAWTYTTDVLPKGKWEVEHWTTARLKKEHGTYQAVDLREELEYGVLDNFPSRQFHQPVSLVNMGINP